MLAATGTLLAGGATGGLATYSLTDSARGATAELTVTGDEAVVRDGSLTAVWLDLAVEWGYAVPSGEQPDTAIIEVAAGADADSLTVVDSAQRGVTFLEESGSETFEADLLKAGALDAADLVPDAAGDSVSTEVVVGAELRVVDTAEMVIAAASKTDTATVTVGKSDYNPDEYGDLAGVGNVTVQTE